LGLVEARWYHREEGRSTREIHRNNMVYLSGDCWILNSRSPTAFTMKNRQSRGEMHPSKIVLSEWSLLHLDIRSAMVLA